MRSGNALRTVAAALLVASLGGCSDMRFWERRARHGAREGYRSTAVDLNNASRRELSQLPDITDQDADRIIKNRPYARKRDLVDRDVLSMRKFEGIRDYVVIGGSRAERGANR